VRPKRPWRAIVACVGVLALVGVAGIVIAEDRPAIKRGVIWDQAATGGASILTNAVVVTPGTSALRLTIALSGTNSVVGLLVTETGSGSTALVSLNDATALTAGNMYGFSVGVSGGGGSGSPPAFTYNVQTTSTTHVDYLVIDEVKDGDL